jgi:CpeT/CpcT family (DUF1001)
MRSVFLLLALAATLGGCAVIQPASKLDRRLQQIAALYVGDYQSQKGIGPAISEPVFVSVRAIDPPVGMRYALYQEIRAGDANGAISRQRLFLFDETPGRAFNALNAFRFSDESAATALRANPTLVRSGALAYAPALGEADCPMQFRMYGPDRFIGIIKPESCQITSTSGGKRRIEAVTVLSNSALESLERGYDEAGTLLFGNAKGQRYIWPRVARADGKPDEMTSRWKPKF